VCGRLGWAAAGLAVLTRGFRSPGALVDAHRAPTPPYAAGPTAALAGATAMIDVSDGLLADLGHVASESGVRLALRRDAFVVPERLAEVAPALGVDPLDWMLTGGEDHALAATFPPGTALPEGFVALGEVEEGEGVLVDGEPYAGSAGWEHFA
jgi:thiamine-monophosphate kinase